jgi:hypothetical protein
MKRIFHAMILPKDEIRGQAPNEDRAQAGRPATQPTNQHVQKQTRYYEYDNAKSQNHGHIPEIVECNPGRCSKYQLPQWMESICRIDPIECEESVPVQIPGNFHVVVTVIHYLVS